MPDELALRKELLEVAKEMETKQLLPATSGNLSVRLSRDVILVTPSGSRKGKLGLSELVKVDLRGNLLEGERNPSSEIKVHLAVYQNQTEAGAVIHAHPPFSTAFAVAGIPLDKGVLPEIIVSLGEVPLVPYATPSTSDLPAQIIPYLRNHRAFLLQNHGVLACGATLADAYHHIESLEFYAKVSLLARLLGGEKTLTETEMCELENIRSNSPY